MKRILITGVGGNVGKYIADDLVQGGGYEVIGICRNSIPQNIDYELINADISDISMESMEHIDVVVHIAANILGDTRALIHDNIEATNNLVRQAERAYVGRFVYMSSVAAYGRVEGELCEESNINNPSVYGITKRLGESIVEESEIPEKIVIQLPKMIGPYVHMDNTKGSGFLTMTKKILHNEKVVCFIPEMEYNNYLHVSELGVFLRHLLSLDKWPEYEKVLVGSEDKLKMMQILRIMRDEINSKSEIIAQNNGTTPEVALININKAKNLGFSPRSAENMLRRFMREICSV